MRGKRACVHVHALCLRAACACVCVRARACIPRMKERAELRLELLHGHERRQVPPERPVVVLTARRKRRVAGDLQRRDVWQTTRRTNGSATAQTPSGRAVKRKATRDAAHRTSTAHVGRRPCLARAGSAVLHVAVRAGGWVRVGRCPLRVVCRLSRVACCVSRHLELHVQVKLRIGRLVALHSKIKSRRRCGQGRAAVSVRITRGGPWGCGRGGPSPVQMWQRWADLPNAHARER